MVCRVCKKERGDSFSPSRMRKYDKICRKCANAAIDKARKGKMEMTKTEIRMQLIEEHLNAFKEKTGWRYKITNHPFRFADVEFTHYSLGKPIKRMFLYMECAREWRILKGNALLPMPITYENIQA